MSRTALLRAAVAPLLAAVLGLAPVGAVASAAPPAVGAALPVITDDVTDHDRPVRIDVGRFEPRAVTPGAMVTVTGTLTNTGTVAITDLNVRLQRGQVLSTRAELAARYYGKLGEGLLAGPGPHVVRTSSRIGSSGRGAPD